MNIAFYKVIVYSIKMNIIIIITSMIWSFCLWYICSDVLLTKIEALEPEPFQANNLSGLNARHLESLMKLACLTEDIPSAFANMYTRRLNSKVQMAKQTEMETARETNALMRKLDEDIARVLEQEQSSYTGVDHNADKKTVKAPLVQLETFDLDGAEDTASSTTSSISPRFPDLAGSEGNNATSNKSNFTAFDEAVDMGRRNNHQGVDFGSSSQESLKEPDPGESSNVLEEPEDHDSLSDFQVRISEQFLCCFNIIYSSSNIKVVF